MTVKICALLGFIFLVAVSYFSHTLNELEIVTSLPEKTKIKIQSEEVKPPPPPIKKQRVQDSLRPVSQKFEAQQLSSQVYGTSGLGGKGFSQGDQISNSLTSAQEISVGPQPRSPIQIGYPDFAKQKALKGFVEIEAHIDISGRVEEIQIVRSEPQGVFDDYVKNEIRKTVFRPALDKGKVVAQKWVQKVRFEYE
jgi:TonB family protein